MKTRRVPVGTLSNPWVLMATGFGAGLTPKAPGTFGTLLALPFFVVAAYAGWVTFAIVLIVMLGTGIVICDQAAKVMGVKDPGSIVWDEFVGMGITVFGLAPIVSLGDALWWLIAFVLFRIFDIAKPWPVRYFDEWSGGLGIMLDDVAAGLYALCCLQLMILVHGLLS